MQLQKKLHVHEKEMQRQKQQQEKLLQQDVDVVHQQKDLQLEELLAEKLQVLLAERLQEKLLVEELQEKLHEDLLHEEGDVNLLSFFFILLAFTTNSISISIKPMWVTANDSKVTM